MGSLTHGGGENEVDTVKAVAVDDFLGAGIKAHSVIVFVDSTLDSTGAVAVFKVAFPPQVFLSQAYRLFQRKGIQWLNFRHSVHLLSVQPT